MQWKSYLRATNPVAMLALLACFVSLIIALNYVLTRRRSRVPGPRGLPLVGNTLQLTRPTWLLFDEWKQQYGPIISVSIAGREFIVLNTSKVAYELLTKRATKYSDRPRLIVAGELLTNGMHVAFARYGDLWRRLRKGAHRCLSKEVSQTFGSFQSLEAVLIAESLLRDPGSWDNHFQRATASLIMGITYNLPPLKSEKDPSIARIHAHITRVVNALYPGHLVEIFHWMEHLPSWLTPWKTEAAYWGQKDTEIFTELYKETLEKNSSNPSVVAALEAQKDQINLSPVERVWLAGGLYGAGTETSYAALQWFIVALVHYPEVQEKAYRELMAVVGPSRPPSFADYDNLPYVRAVLKEVLRVWPPTPLGIPHYVTEDDWYEGYFIPKGTTCLANIWSINRDQEVHGPDADQFRPERYLDADGKVATPHPETHEEGHSTFGYGRRICVGRYVANSSLFIDFATILWACHVRPYVDDTGQVNLPDKDMSSNSGVTLHPVPFKITIEARSPQVPTLLSQTKEFYLHANELSG
ncbi:cytochrome P450 [Scleroderma yunnanense]